MRSILRRFKNRRSRCGKFSCKRSYLASIHSAKVYPCFLERPLLFVLLLALFIVRVLSFVAHAATGSSFLLTKKGTKDVPRGFPPLGTPPVAAVSPLTFVRLRQAARYAARRGCVASHRIATLPRSTPQSAGGSVPFIVCGSVRLCYVVDAVRYELAHRFPTVGATRFSK